VVVAFGMVVILGFMGLGLDLGYLRYTKRQLQKVADAAAIAGAMELTTCGSTRACSAMTTAAQDALMENGLTGSTLETGCARSSASLVVTVNNPPCFLGTADPNHNNAKVVEVVVSQSAPLNFAKFLGARTMTLTARSEAALGNGSNCIFALDPTDAGTIAVDWLASINSQCGMVDESKSSTAMECFLGAITASQIGIVGGYSSFCFFIHPTPQKHILTPTPVDPLAYLPVPPEAGGACGTSTSSPYMGYSGSTTGLVLNGKATLNAGVYCGGIEINQGANVTFNPGTYILTSAVNKSGTSYGLTVDVGAQASGAGVTFFNTLTAGKTAGPIQFNFTSFGGGNGINFTAPTSGTYEGILFFQDSANTTQATIIGSGDWNTVLEGAYYFPMAKVLFAFDGPVKYNILDAWQIEFEALTFATGTYTAGFSNNYSTLADGSPVKSTALVE